MAVRLVESWSLDFLVSGQLFDNQDFDWLFIYSLPMAIIPSRGHSRNTTRVKR